MCCTNPPCSLRGGDYASTSSKAFWDAYSSYLGMLSISQELLLTEQQGKAGQELWEMQFRKMESQLGSCIHHLSLLQETQSKVLETLAARDLETYRSIYVWMDYGEIDSRKESTGAYLPGEEILRAKVRHALRENGDLGGYALIQSYYDQLLPAALSLASKLSQAKSQKQWKSQLISEKTGIHEAAAGLMGRFVTAQIASSYFSGYYLENIRLEQFD